MKHHHMKALLKILSTLMALVVFYGIYEYLEAPKFEWSHVLHIIMLSLVATCSYYTHKISKYF